MFHRSRNSTFLRIALILSLIAGVMAVVPAFASPTVVYVDAGATGSNNGTSWVDAFPDLQLALQPASPGTEIWVASGTYKPGNNRAAAFVLKDGVALYGGFAGGETSLSQRDPGTNLTVLSGDIGIPGDSSDNSYHVLVGSGTNNSALLDGFVVRGGNANGSPPDDRGGGIYAYQGEPFLANTTFENNSASLFGGGVFIGGDLYSPEITSYPVLKDLVIKNNSAAEGAGLFTENYVHADMTNIVFEANIAARVGGGMEDRLGTLSLTNVIFRNNTTGGAAGGMQIFSNSASLTDVTFSGNSAGYYAGGVAIDSVDPILTNVTFYGNSAPQGGGIWSSNSKPVLTNVTFQNNSASALGGAIYSENNSQTTLQNTILWGNTAPNGAQIYNNASTSTISYSVIQGGFAGGTNIITEDPLLGAPGNYGGFTETIPLQVGSSAIDAGNNSVCPPTDQRGVSRPQGDSCDIGSYEYVFPTTPTALPTFTFTPSITPTTTEVTVTPTSTKKGQNKPTSTPHPVTVTPTRTPAPTKTPRK